MLIVQSRETDIYRNLAVEETLLEEVHGQGPMLFLWRAGPAVVIGKNQNPWRECAVRRLKECGIPLARRVSGGGTVWHDPGNLNYAILVPRETYEPDRAWRVVLRALEAEGIAARREGKSNLCAEGRKFSGTAFAFKRGYTLHHGTLLIAADLTRLREFLRADFPQMETRAVASVPAPVVNLSERAPHLTVERLEQRLIEAFQGEYGSDAESARFWMAEQLEAVAAARYARQRTDAWIFQHTPPFELGVSGCRLTVRKGRVEQSEQPEWTGRLFHELAVEWGEPVAATGFPGI